MSELTSQARASRPNRLRRGATALVSVIAGATALAGCGNNGPLTEKDSARVQAIQEYDTAFRSASPAAKFTIQYLRKDVESVVRFKHQDHGFLGQGMLGGMDASTWEVQFNNACLLNSAYDISGGRVQGEIHGFSNGEVSGNNPAAAAYAEVNPANQDELLVQSGHDNPVILKFDGLNGANQLTPADAATKNILYTYGCEVGPISVNVGSTYDTNSN